MWALIDRGWRLLATGVGFSFFGIGSLFLGVVIFPILHLFARPRSRAERYSRYCVHSSFRVFIGYMRWMGIATYRFERIERLKPPGQLIIANHPSLIDVTYLVAQIPNAHCIVKRAAWRNPFMGLVMRATGYIPHDAPDQLTDACVEVLKEGETLIMFPEGTRTVDSAHLRFARGAANIALRANVPLRPVYLSIEPRTLTKGEPWYRIPKSRFHMALVVGNEIDSQGIGGTGSLRARAKCLNQYLMTHFEEKCEAYFGDRADGVHSGDQGVDH